jgi:hypothetical protein
LNFYDVESALEVLKKYSITESKQMVTRWIRKGKLRGYRSENRKEGYKIPEEELYRFIDDKRPGFRMLHETVMELRKGMKDITEDLQQIKKEFTHLKKKGKNVKEIRGKTNAVAPKLLQDVFQANMQQISKDGKETEIVFNEVSALLFAGDTLRDHIHADGVFTCPLTKVKYKYPKPFFKHVVQTHIEKSLDQRTKEV